MVSVSWRVCCQSRGRADRCAPLESPSLEDEVPTSERHWCLWEAEGKIYRDAGTNAWVSVKTTRNMNDQSPTPMPTVERYVRCPRVHLSVDIASNAPAFRLPTRCSSNMGAGTRLSPPKKTQENQVSPLVVSGAARDLTLL